MLVVAVAVLGSLTLLPALLGLLGDRVDRGQLPLVSRLRRPAGQSRVWGAALDRVLARPALTAGLAASILVVLALPVLRLHTATPGASDLPQNVAALRTYNQIQRAFPGAARQRSSWSGRMTSPHLLVRAQHACSLRRTVRSGLAGLVQTDLSDVRAD